MVVDEQEVLERLVNYFVQGQQLVKDKRYSFDNQGRLNIKGSLDAMPGLLSIYGGVGFPDGKLPIRFGTVSHNFDVGGCRLTTLEGCPTYVGLLCSVADNPLETLVGAPSRVDYGFSIQNLPNLKSLEGFPESVFMCRFTWQPDLPLLRLLQAQRLEMDDYSLRKEPGLCLEILQKYAGQGEAGAFACGAELATAGLKENARW